MRTINAKRETVQLWVAVGIVLLLSAYRLTAEMMMHVELFFAAYTDYPVAVWLLNGLFFWLLAMLWIAYRRWRDALRAQVELERVLMSISPDSLVVINRDRVITMCSGQVKAMFGRSEKELIGEKTDILYFDRRIRGEKGEIASRLEQFGFHVGYATGRHVDGSTFPLEIITGMIRFQQGAVVLMRDITERFNIEEALRHSEARFELFMRYFPGFAFIKDSAGRHVYLNKNYERVFGWNLAESIGKTDEELRSPEIAKQFAETDAKVLGEQKATKYIMRMPDKKGERSLLTVKFPIPASERESMMIGGLSLDVTDQEAAERERRKIEQQMQQAQKLESLGVLAGGIAHDFNNLLMGMLGHADLALTHGGGEPKVRRHIEEVVASAQRATELANQLLAYSGEGKFIIEVVNLSDLVEQLGSLLRVSVDKKAQLQVELADDLPTVECDPTQIRQVVMNLIVNASDALENQPGVITLKTGLQHKTPEDFSKSTFLKSIPEEGDYVFVEVSDTGVGMDEETLSKIFDPFFTTKFAGHGLGLAAVQGIVRSHHGVVSIESTVGKGTVFTVYLPASDKALTSGRETLPIDDDWRGEGTVLLAEDEDIVREVASMMLGVLGFNVVCVENGKEAVAAAQNTQNDFKAMVLDLTMPEMGGVEAFHEIRKFNKTVPVILSSGYNKEENSADLEDGSPPLFLKKPYRLDVMRQVLRMALSR